MAKLPPISRIVKEDFPDEPWAEKLLWPVNRFFESVVSALNRNLTFTENLAGEIKQISFTTQATVADTWPIKFLPSTPSRPTDVWVTSLRRTDGATTTSATSIDWELASDGQVQINNIAGLTGGEGYIIRLAVLSE